MEVQVKLLLQGGHVWEFCCNQDDPIVFGLVSALPGADVAGNLPPDGLVQVEARNGERLFLTRSSLVSVEIVPVADPLQFIGAKRLAGPLDRIPVGASVPAPFLLARDVLAADLRAALLAQALGQNDAPPAKTAMRMLAFGAIEQQLAPVLRAQVAMACDALGIAAPGEVELDLRLYAVGDAQAISWEAKPNDVMHMVYQFHGQPKRFSGGGIRLFDTEVVDGAKRVAARFRDVDIGDNELLVFPQHVVSAGLPVRLPTRAFADGLFVIHGIVRRNPAVE